MGLYTGCDCCTAVPVWSLDKFRKTAIFPVTSLGKILVPGLAQQPVPGAFY